MKKATVVIAEDHPLVRRGIRGMIESQPDFRVIGEADNGIEALRVIEQTMPDLFVADVVMPGMTGIEVLQHCQRLNPRPKTVFLSLYDNEIYVWSAMRNGASAYILKHSAAEHLVPAMRSAMAGEEYIFPHVSDSTVMRVDSLAAHSDSGAGVELTDRERNVMHMLADGFANTQISSRFEIPSEDALQLVGGLMKKFGAETRSDLVRMAQKRAF